MNQGLLSIPCNLIRSGLLGKRSCFGIQNLYHYVLNIGQLDIELSIHSIKSEGLGPLKFSF